MAFVKDEAFLQNAHISHYKHSTYNNHEPERKRKLLLHKKEINRLYGLMKEKGYSCVPLKLYFKKGRIKVELGFVRSKKTRDKRQTIQKREAERKINRQLKKF